MPTFREMLAAAKAAIREVEPAEAEQEIAAGGAVVLDVREPDEYEQGALPGAVHIPRGTLETSVEGRIPDKSSHVVVYCAGGTRSAFAAKTMQELGYTDVASVIGGFNRWKDEGRPWSAPQSLTPEQRNRYQRHLLLPEVGEAGQLKLLDSKVLLLGRRRPRLAGRALPGRRRGGHPRHHRHGRGRRLQPAAPDPPQHRPDRRAEGRLGQEDPDPASTPTSTWSTYDVRLGADNILDIIDGYDVIVDGTDNFPTRYLVNDASLLKRIPVVHGSIFRFEGQATVFNPYVGPVLPLHDPRAPAGRAGPELLPRPACSACCPGIIGSIQAIEAIKILLGIGETLQGRLLAYDALEESFRTFKVHRDPECPACGPDAGEIVIAEYDDLCMPHAAPSACRRPA